MREAARPKEGPKGGALVKASRSATTTGTGARTTHKGVGCWGQPGVTPTERRARVGTNAAAPRARVDTKAAAPRARVDTNAAAPRARVDTNAAWDERHRK